MTDTRPPTRVCSVARRGEFARASRSSESRAGWARAASHVFLGVIPVLSVVALVVFYVTTHNFAVDFSNWYWPAGDRLLHGRSLYLEAYPRALYYPPLAGLLFGPFALFERGIASGLFTTLVLLAIPATLRLLDVRDWRVYGIVMLWHPIILGWQTANLSLLLALGVAVAWRLRDQPLVTGLTVGLLVSLKLFLWPLGLFFLATRRYAALGWAVTSAVALTALSFAVVGFSELPHYWRALESFLAHTEPHSYSLTSLALNLGAGDAARYVVALGAAGAVAAICVVVGRRGRDHSAIAACLVACLLASPIVEAHYLVLMVVPLALTSPRLNAAWAIPLALWVTPVDGPANWQRLLSLSVLAGVLAYALFNDRFRSERTATPITKRVSIPGREVLDQLPAKPESTDFGDWGPSGLGRRMTS